MATISVTTDGELKAAITTLSKSGGGTVLVEKTRDSYTLSASNLGAADAPVVITSADPDNPAVFDHVRLVNGQNLSFEKLVFNSIGVDRPSWHRDFMLESSKDISVRDSSFRSRAEGAPGEDGDAVRGENMGFVRDNENFEFTGNEVSNYFTGLSIVETTGIVVESNRFTKMQGDGINGGGMQEAVFRNNHFSDWLGSAKSTNHDDMFQIWGVNMEQLSKNILIEGNFFDSGEGSATQTILIQNERWQSKADNYSNIVIRDNVIYNGHTHGITVDDSVGVKVLNNTVLHNSQAQIPTGGASNAPWIRVYNTEGAVVEGNIAAGINAGGIDLSKNRILDYGTPQNSNHYSHHFVNLETGGKVDLRDLELLSDSPWFGRFGSSLSAGQSLFEGGSLLGRLDLLPDGLTAVLRFQPVPGDLSAVVLDASLSHDENGPLGSGARYEWHFPDGTVATGKQVRADFSMPGLQDVRLVVRSADGETDSITRSVPIEDALVQRTEFEGGRSATGVSFSDLAGTPFKAGLTGQAFHMDGDSEAAFSKWHSGFHELDQFSVDIVLSKETAQGAGKFYDFHRVMGMSVRPDGSIGFSVTTDDGKFSVRSGDIRITDTGWHHVTATYNSVAGELLLYVDGELAGQTEASGITAAYNHTGPQLGVPDFKSASFKGLIDSFGFYREALSETEIEAAHARTLDPGGAAPAPAPEGDGSVTAEPQEDADKEDDGAPQEPASPAPDTPDQTETETPDETGADTPDDIAEEPAEDTEDAAGDGSDETPEDPSTDEAEDAPRDSEDPQNVKSGIPDFSLPDVEAVIGTEDADSLYGDVAVDEILGGGGGDRLYGRGGNDLLDGGRGNDFLYGGAGHDVLLGGHLHDIINGGNGDDILMGGDHDDELTGGAGLDLFLYDGDSGDDLITDFELGVDKLVLDLNLLAENSTTRADITGQITVSGSEINIDLGQNNTIRIQTTAENTTETQIIQSFENDITWI